MGQRAAIPGTAAVRTTMPGSTAPARMRALLDLAKPRIVLLELVAVLTIMHVASGHGADPAWRPGVVAAIALGTALVAGSANAMNQWLERERDARMLRTRSRPIPSGRVSPAEALSLGMLALAAGEATLATHAGLAPALVALATWVLYVAVYTPLKTRSWLNTAIGAVAGATPLWIGWTAGGGRIDEPLALATLAVLYIWQFPHFMAIAWLCRHDYAIGGYRMSTTLDPSGGWAGWQAVVGSALLAPVSLAPLFIHQGGAPVAYATIVLGAALMLLSASGQFLAQRDDRSARRLMRASLLYVPAWLAALWIYTA